MEMVFVVGDSLEHTSTDGVLVQRCLRARASDTSRGVGGSSDADR